MGLVTRGNCTGNLEEQCTMILRKILRKMYEHFTILVPFLFGDCLEVVASKLPCVTWPLDEFLSYQFFSVPLNGVLLHYLSFFTCFCLFCCTFLIDKRHPSPPDPFEASHLCNLEFPVPVKGHDGVWVHRAIQ